jgi:hypothetical protein
VVLRTPPKDSTGLPHILEHSVLCGSRKYPVKEPFVELIKSSLNTFLNAFTYPDRTCYPVAAAQKAHFLNRVEVYHAGGFLPPHTPPVFAQEGWHYELDKEEDELAFKGVVFNEMKGVYSQPDSVMFRDAQLTLFPDNTYGVDSGGDPERIPDLSFDDFMNFHGTLYHPSNARLWFSGDDPVQERLRLLDEYLSQFERREIDSNIATQPLFDEPRRHTRTFTVSDDAGEGTPKNQHMLCTSWVLSEDRMPTEEALVWEILDQLLLGTSAAPLRKALDESGLGESVIGGGLSDELRQPTFSIGLKGVAEADVPKVEALVMDALERIANEGFGESAIESALNTIEFALRENNTGSFPRGLGMMLRSASAWIYDQDPLEGLRYAQPLADMKARLEAGEPIFVDALRAMLASTHRVTLEMQPSATEGKEIAERELARLKAKEDSMNKEDREEVVELTRALKEKQETPDPPEALASIPALDVGDLPKRGASIPSAQDTEQDATVLSHDLFTNEILYTEVLLDLRTVPTRLLPLVPLFCRCLQEMGTESESFVELSERIGSKTGGISAYPVIMSKPGSDEPVAHLMLRGKATKDQSKDMYAIMSDMLLTSKLDDKERFRQMVLETKSNGEAAVVGGGHSVAASLLGAMDSVAGRASEATSGIEYLEFIRALEGRIDGEWDAIAADLAEIRRCLLGRKGAIVNLTGDSATLEAQSAALSEFLSTLPAAGGEAQEWAAPLARTNTAITVPTQVNYVGKGANLYTSGYELHGSAFVINKLLGTTWLWDKVRVVGGAYGGFCSFDNHSGMFTYLSYRDPNLLGTVDNYDGTPQFLRDLDLDADALNKAIVGAIGDVDSYQLPDAKGYTSLLRHLLGITEEQRQERREQILGTTVQDFRQFAEVLEAVKNDGVVAAVASEEAVAKAHDARAGFFSEVKKLL